MPGVLDAVSYAPSLMFAPGIAASRSRVYCSLGLSNTSSVDAASTMRPFCITQTLSAMTRTTLSSIGRAIGLIVRNIAGFRPGASYMGTFGYPLAFALAEHEDSPWPAFHAECGFAADASTVTIGVTNNWGSSPAPYDLPERSGALTALDLLCKEIPKKTRLFHFPARGPSAGTRSITSITRWNRSRSFSITMSNGVVVVPFSL